MLKNHQRPPLSKLITTKWPQTSLRKLSKQLKALDNPPETDQVNYKPSLDKEVATSNKSNLISKRGSQPFSSENSSLSTDYLSSTTSRTADIGKISLNVSDSFPEGFYPEDILSELKQVSQSQISFSGLEVFCKKLSLLREELVHNHSLRNEIFLKIAEIIANNQLNFIDFISCIKKINFDVGIIGAILKKL